MSKKKNKSKKPTPAKNLAEQPAKLSSNPATEDVVVPSTTAQENKDKKGKVVEVKAKDVKKKKDKPKKPNKVATALKNTGSELKKITWPKFKDVVKQTGIVLVVVIVFALVVFGLDRLCSWLTGFLY